jgi:FixJ family two-component response regulator
VLVADDDLGTLTTFGLLLREAGFTVEAASGWRDCTTAIRREPFDMILLDLRLGRADGVTLVRRLRRIGISAPIVIVTGFASMDAAVAALRAGADDFVAKPLDEQDLLTVVRRNMQSSTERVPRPRPLMERTGTAVDQLRGRLAQQLNRASKDGPADAIVRERARTTTILARACAQPEIAIADFVACATALRRLLSAHDGPVRHALIEARDGLRDDLWPASPMLPIKVQQVIELESPYVVEIR